MADDRALLDVAEELYAAPLDAFTSTRNARAAGARKAGDRDFAAAIAAFRKPTASAWASNVLFRSSPQIGVDLADLRERISSATTAGDRDALRDLTESRHALVRRLVDEARSLADDAGKPLGSSAVDELVDALSAALADADVAEAMSSGRLTAAPHTGGMSRGDLADVVALPPENLTRDDPDDDLVDVEPAAPRGSGRARAGNERADRPAMARSGRSGSRSTPRASNGPTSTERRRHERELREAEERAAAARADREKRERKRDESAHDRDELADEVARARASLRELERRLEDADETVDALTADIRSRELEWKRSESAARTARRVVDEDRAASGLE
jgi:hypothetical protein